MRNFYTGLLFFGASFGAHAAEMHKHGHAAKHASAAMHYTQYAPDGRVRGDMVYSDLKSGSTAISPQQFVASATSSATLTQSQKNLVNVLNAVLQQRMVLKNEQVQLTFEPGAAVMETDHLKVAVHSNSTSVTWHKSF